MEFTCEQIGLNQSELQERIIETIADRMLSKYVTYHEEGGEYEDIENTEIRNRLERMITDRINSEVERVGTAYLEPRINDMVEGLTLQATNKWGEAKGEKLTFTEYMVQRAEAYMIEPVNYNGKTRQEADSYNFSATSTRLAYLLEKYLHYQIEQAMKKVLAGANKTWAQALTDAVRIKAAEVANSVSIDVKTK